MTLLRPTHNVEFTGQCITPVLYVIKAFLGASTAFYPIRAHSRMLENFLNYSRKGQRDGQVEPQRHVDGWVQRSRKADRRTTKQGRSARTLSYTVTYARQYCLIDNKTLYTVCQLVTLVFVLVLLVLLDLFLCLSSIPALWTPGFGRLVWTLHFDVALCIMRWTPGEVESPTVWNKN